MSQRDSAPSERIPVTVLTGFLGSGKTTLLNQLVRAPEMSRALVVINEFGAVSLDHDLIARSDEELVVEMMGGCLCCTIRGDLAETLRNAPWRFARNGECWFDRLVIETTGLADPAPILHTLMADIRLASLYKLDGVVTTVDAATGMATLDAQEEAVRQAAMADRILLTKTDLVSADERAAIGQRLRAINPAAPIIPVLNGKVEVARLFDAGLHDPSTKSEAVRNWLQAEAYEQGGHEHGHDHNHDHHDDHDHHDVNRHDDRIRATCLTFDEPLDPIRFERWLDVLSMFKGPDILRVKGILNLVGETKPVVIHGVQHIFHPPVRLDEWPSEDRRTRVVFITRDLSPDDLRSTMALLTTGLENYGLDGFIEGLAQGRMPAELIEDAKP